MDMGWYQVFNMVMYKSPDSGKVYAVTKTSCSCPHWMYKLAKAGGVCKHMAALFYNQKVSEKEQEDLKVFAGGIDMDEAAKQFGDKKIEELIRMQVIFEHKWKYFLCE